MSSLPPERDLPSEGARLRDRHLIDTVESRRSVGEEMARSGEVSDVAGPAPAIPAAAAVGVREPGASERAAASIAPARRRRFWPRVAAVALGLVAVVVGYFLFSLWQVWSTGRSDQVRAVDAIVVMGAAQYDGRPSPQLRARLDHVAELWPQGLASTVVVTGGNRPGDRFTEAEASAKYLEGKGVPESAILLEPRGTSTYESLDTVHDLLVARGMSSVLIVTDPYHSLRSRMIADQLGLRAYVSPTETSVVTGAREFERDLGEAAGVAVGRVIGFDRLNDLTD
jgi:uncharacterized SAM-binding protein YcdF (DUF218 family)